MNSLTDQLLPGTATAPEGTSAAGVEFLSGDVMTRFWNEGESTITAAAKKKGKKKSKKPLCRTGSSTGGRGGKGGKKKKKTKT
jgi:hypothetical protein